MTDSSIDEPRYRVTDIVNACGLSGNTLRSWLGQGHIRLERQDELPGKEGWRKLTFRRALQIALTAALVEYRIPAQRAARLAFGFTDVADPSLEDGRAPGELMRAGRTFMLIRQDADFPWIVSDTTNIFSRVTGAGFGAPTSLLVVDVTKIWHALAAALDQETAKTMNLKTELVLK